MAFGNGPGAVIRLSTAVDPRDLLFARMAGAILSAEVPDGKAGAAVEVPCAAVIGEVSDRGNLRVMASTVISMDEAVKAVGPATLEKVFPSAIRQDTAMKAADRVTLQGRFKVYVCKT